MIGQPGSCCTVSNDTLDATNNQITSSPGGVVGMGQGRGGLQLLQGWRHWPVPCCMTAQHSALQAFTTAPCLPGDSDYDHLCHLPLSACCVLLHAALCGYLVVKVKCRVNACWAALRHQWCNICMPQAGLGFAASSCLCMHVCWCVYCLLLQ